MRPSKVNNVLHLPFPAVLSLNEILLWSLASYLDSTMVVT